MKKLSTSTAFRSHEIKIEAARRRMTLGHWFVRKEIELYMTIFLILFLAMIILMSEFLTS